ncbi:hypothetical protein P4_00046 [Xanthomonas phage P4]|uniref:Uncharacterized protein n=1 Tax=Xanthomonas phage P4 TaxID=3003372 RepID=A0AAF0AHM6_9CAUD|nr:hypothetical protein P4_00046 [Xanthomonas phage P4]
MNTEQNKFKVSLCCAGRVQKVLYVPERAVYSSGLTKKEQGRVTGLRCGDTYTDSCNDIWQRVEA